MKQQTEIKIAPRINYITVDLCTIIEMKIKITLGCKVYFIDTLN